MLRALVIAAILTATARAQPGRPPVDVADLRAAIRGVDPAVPRTVDIAVRAIEAGAKRQEAALLPDLAALVARAPDRRIVVAQVAAARSIPRLGATPKAAVAALSPAIDHPFPKPTATSADELSTQLAVAGAAVNALAELQDPAALDVTLRLLYRAPPLLTQVRRALVAYGPSVSREIDRLLAGKHVALEQLIKRERLDQACEDARTCQPISARDFYAAIVAGDLGDPSLTEPLFGVLAKPALPAYVVDGAPGPSQHQAAFEGLRKIAPASAAPRLLAMVRDPKRDVTERALAASAYGFVATDGSAIGELGAIAADNTAEDALRQAAAEAFARLSTEPTGLEAMRNLANRYLDAAAKQQAQADTNKDPQMKKASSSAATAYLGYARMFHNHMARIALGITCRVDAQCYSDAAWRGRAETLARLRPMLPNLDRWTEEHKQALWEAVIERAMLEVGKRGPAKPEVLAKLLEHVGDPQRIPRQAILLALAKTAPRPCPACITKLDAVIETDRTRNVGELAIETILVRNYLRWAN